ncbi:MAG: SPFH domain-containing protein [Gammaproteobacteria bacterium]|nr:MAG: SPFH domain-containing protein [Gammaproteobacteria bacterium]
MKYLMMLSALGLVGCSVYSPDAGHEVVLIEKPWIFGHGGVDSDPVKPGRTFAAITTEGVDVYMQPQKFDTEMHDTMTSDGVPISFHAIVVLQVTDSVGMNETAISTTALDAVDAEIRDALKAFIKEKGLPIQLVTMTEGRANPPDAIKNQRIETATQEQRIQTEQQTKLAEVQRKSAEEARAAADNAYRQAIGLSPEQYVQLKRIEMENRVCADGKCTFIENGGAVPAFSVK